MIRETLDRLLFPGPAKDYRETVAAYGDLSVLPTGAFLYGLRPGHEVSFDLEPGVRILASLEAVGEIDEAGIRQVICTVNGQLRTLSVRDKSVVSDVPPAERADPATPGHIAAPFDRHQPHDQLVGPLRTPGCRSAGRGRRSRERARSGAF